MRPNVEITARDGYKLSGTFSPSRQHCVKGFILVNSALGVRQRYYARFCRHFNERGFHTFTYDYRGIGDSVPASGLQGFGATLTQWAAWDADAALQWSRSEARGLPLIGIGHSFGGCCFGLTKQPECLDGIILVAAQTGYYKDYPRPFRWKLVYAWFLAVPFLCRTKGFLPARTLGIGEPLPKDVALEWAKWCRSSCYLKGHFNDELRDSFDRFQGRMLSISSNDDRYAVPRAVDKMTAYYTGAVAIERIRIVPEDCQGRQIGHFGFFDRRIGRFLWPRMTAWLERRCELAG